MNKTQIVKKQKDLTGLELLLDKVLADCITNPIDLLGLATRKGKVNTWLMPTALIGER